MAPPNRRGGNGRKKTVIRRIEQEDARHVCYSKRRAGLFKKASDLAVLTGAQVAALAFSPGGKAFSFGHPSVDSVVERFLAGDGAGAGAREEGAADERLLAAEGAGAGAGEGAAEEDNKVKKLAHQLAQLHTELTEVKMRTERTDETMAKERAAGDQIATWVDSNVRDMGDEDMAAFFASLLQVMTDVSDRANQVLVEAFHVDVSRKVEMAPPLPPHIFGGSTFEYGSSSGTANAKMEFQFLVPPPQEQGFKAGLDMQQMVMAALPPPQELASGMDVQQQMVMGLPPAQVVSAGMDMQEMPPAQVVAAEMPLPPEFDKGMDRELQQWLMAMPKFPAQLEMAQQGLEPNADEEEIQTRVQ